MSLLAGTVPAQPADRHAAVNGLHIHYVKWGARDNKPMVLLHGIARVAHTFDPIETPGH